MNEEHRREFTAFVHARSAALLRTAYLLTGGDAHLAQDLVQASLAKTWRAWGSIESREAPDAFVRRVMVTTSTSWWRRRWWGERPTAETPEPAGTPALDGEWDGVDARLTLMAALRRLPPRQRAAVVLRYYEDLPEADVARLMGTGTASVRSQASRGLTKLRADGALAPWAHHSTTHDVLEDRL